MGNLETQRTNNPNHRLPDYGQDLYPQFSRLTTLIWDVPESYSPNIRQEFSDYRNIFSLDNSSKGLKEKLHSVGRNATPILISSQKRVARPVLETLKTRSPFQGWAIQVNCGDQLPEEDIRNHFFLRDFPFDQVRNLLNLIERNEFFNFTESLRSYLLGKKKYHFKVALKHLKNLYQQGKTVKAEGHNQLETFLKFQMFLLEIKQSSFHFDKLTSYVEQIQKSAKILRVIEKLEWIPEKSVYRAFLERKEDEKIFPLSETQKGFLLAKKHPKASEGEFAYLISEVFLALEEFHFQKERFEGVQAISRLWGEAFQKLPYPVAIFNAKGELVLHNAAFSKIEVLPKECLRLKDGETSEIKSQAYQIERRELEYGTEIFQYFTFHSTQEQIATSGKGVSSEELGIISSSIAHELNNPIAGILAAISLLEIEEGLSQEQVASINDMKKGAKRCRDLIQIFLGFSRAEPKKEEERIISTTEPSFRQAVDLLRFRMIESDIRFEIHYHEGSAAFGGELNSSVMAMIFYLILGETLTTFSHQRLIMDDSENTIQATYREKQNQMSFTMTIELEDMDQIYRSRLVQHLIDFEGLELEVFPSGFSLAKKQENTLFS